MSAIDLHKDVFGLPRGSKDPHAIRTVDVTLANSEHVVREVRHLRHTARDLRRQIPAFDEQIKSRRKRTKRLMGLADNLHSSIFAIGAATAVAGGATHTHAWLQMGSWAMLSGVVGAVLTGVVATAWDWRTKSLTNRRQMLLSRASRYEAMAASMDSTRRPSERSAMSGVFSGKTHLPSVVS
jgi:hypothetical protein